MAQQGAPVADRPAAVQAQRVQECLLHGILGVAGVPQDAPRGLERHAALLADNRSPVGQTVLLGRDAPADRSPQGCRTRTPQITVLCHFRGMSLAGLIFWLEFCFCARFLPSAPFLLLEKSSRTPVC